MNTNLFLTLSETMDMFYEIIGVIAGLSTAIPSIPQIFRTLKTKNVKGLSTGMFLILALGGICWIIYGYHLNSWQMEFFNTIGVICSVTMIILINLYSKKEKNTK